MKRILGSSFAPSCPTRKKHSPVPIPAGMEAAYESGGESGAEETPLLAQAAALASHDGDVEESLLSSQAAQRLKSRDLRSFCFKGLPWIVALVVLEVAIIRAESAITFPYLRSLQRCSAPKHDPSTGQWSGSVYCLDRGIVARMAQAEANYVQGIGQLVHTASLPFLGWFADRFGRKPLIVLAFAGLLAEALLNWAIQRVDVLFLSVAVQMGTNGLTPALMAMIADGTDPDDRLGAYIICMLAAVPAYALVYVSITHFVLAEHLAHYAHTWRLIAVLAMIGLLVALSAPETLEARRSGLRDAERQEEWDADAADDDETRQKQRLSTPSGLTPRAGAGASASDGGGSGSGSGAGRGAGAGAGVGAGVGAAGGARAQRGCACRHTSSRAAAAACARMASMRVAAGRASTSV